MIAKVVLLSMFLGVSNYNMRPMDKTYLRILLFLIFITSFCNSEDYKYDENYDYYNENYDNYNQGLNDYYGHQNILAPGPPIPPNTSPNAATTTSPSR